MPSNNDEIQVLKVWIEEGSAYWTSEEDLDDCNEEIFPFNENPEMTTAKMDMSIAHGLAMTPVG